MSSPGEKLGVKRMRRVRIRDPGIEARVGAGETQTWNGEIRYKHVPHSLMSSHFDTINVH